MCVCEERKREREREREREKVKIQMRVSVELLCIFPALGYPFLLLQLPLVRAHPVVRVIRQIENACTNGNFDEDRPSYLLLLLFEANVAPQTPTPIYNPATFSHSKESLKKFLRKS